MLQLREIVESGLCIGCGLCASIAPGVEMRMTETGVERPTDAPVADHRLALINAVCPGLTVELEPQAPSDAIWGPSLGIARGHATDPEARLRGATGGVLTALGQFLLASGDIDHVLHIAPKDDHPLEWSPIVSSEEDSVLEGSGSRYGPAAPLTGLMQLLDAGERFAVIAKPCDAAAVRNLARHDPRVGELVHSVLVMACGGASKMSKTWELLDDFGVARDDVASISYRGQGNPGPTTVLTKDGGRHETTYLDMWADEGTWDLQWRCKVCPDGMGEVADLVSLDCWPGGAPVGEDDGFNGIIARTPVGKELLDRAVAAGVLTLTDEDLPLGVLESWQPHQSRRKKAVPARLAAIRDAGLPFLATRGLHLDVAGSELSEEARQAEYEGARDRIARGGNRDPLPG